ncbi:MAG: hypothetical protein RR986_04980 [Longicatena sp.]
MNIGIICSDERMIQVADNLSNDDTIIKIDQDSDFLALPMMDAIIFPIHGISEFGYLKYKDKEVHVPRLFWDMMDKQTILFCGIKNKFLETLPQTKHYYLEDLVVIHENALLTAEGILNEIIGCNCKSIYKQRIDVVGYGNCGKTIVDVLRNLQVDVRVIRRECDQTQLFIDLMHWNQCGDIIVNTSPSLKLNADNISSWSIKPVIIDIVTPPCMSQDTANKLGIKIIRAQNLPGRFACISAGNIIANYVRRKLKNEK